MKKIRIVFQGIPFCYGPASHILAITNQIRSKLSGTSVELIALAEGTVYELLSMSACLDRVHEFSTNKNPISDNIASLLESANKIVSVGDFVFASQVYDIGKRVAFVDPLLWMWDKLPEQIGLCAQYFAVNFDGVGVRLGELRNAFPEGPEPILVNQICEIMPAKKKRERSPNTVILQFGGMLSPLGCNLDLAVAMTEEVIKAISGLSSIERVFVRGSSQIMTQISSRSAYSDRRVEFGPVSQNSFLEEIVNCGFLLTVPGMSIVYEAMVAGANTMFILPLNYSQHRQMAIYRKIFEGVSSIVWDSFPGYGTLPAGMDEQKAVDEAINLGSRFASDSNARDIFRDRILTFLEREGKVTLRPTNGRTKSYAILLDGAKQIAMDLIRELLCFPYLEQPHAKYPK